MLINTRVSFFLTILLAQSLFALDVSMPTFTKKENIWAQYATQIYDPARPNKEMLHQLNFWAREGLEQSALQQALNDVVSNNGKFSGTVTFEETTYNLYHASAGQGTHTATLFYVVIGNVAHIISIATHVPVKRCQDPVYRSLGWDERFTPKDMALQLL